jgi:hypothetical protein
MLFCLMVFSMMKIRHMCKQQITGLLILSLLLLNVFVKKDEAQILWNRFLATIFYFGLIALLKYGLRLSLSFWNMKHKICLEELSLIT